MSEKTLFIKIFQPFAQYRNPFTFYYAQTYPLPPKSTIIGMLQNAVGDWYGNEHGIEKWWETENGLKISIHGGFESIFWNYQQLIKGYVEILPKQDKLTVINQGLPLYNEGMKSQRSPVYQQELFNGHLYIFVRGENTLLQEIKEALENTKKILSLGRSEDVVFIRKVEFVNGEPKPPMKSIWLTYPTYIKNIIGDRTFPIKNEKYPVYSIPTRVIFKNNGTPVKKKAEISMNTEREVEFTPVIYTGFDYIVKLSEAVSYEEFNIEYEEKNGNEIEKKCKKFKIITEWGWL